MYFPVPTRSVKVGAVVEPAGILLSIAHCSLALSICLRLPTQALARESSRAKACVGNLKQIDSAKEQWAMDNKIPAGSTTAPTFTDLVGTGKYIKSTPECPSAGTYTISAVGTPPTCSVGGTAGAYDAHVLP